MPEKSRSIHLLGSEVEASQFFSKDWGQSNKLWSVDQQVHLVNMPYNQTVNNVVKFAF